MFGEGLGVELGVRHQGGHPRLAVLAGHGDAIDDGLGHAGAFHQHLFDLGGRDVLALPAEGVAHPVDEVEIALGVLFHQVARAEPAVALLEDVGQDLLLRGGLVSIAREVVADVVADLADGFADLADAGQAAQAVRAADRLFAVHVELDQADIDLFLQVARHPADGALFAVEVEQGDIAFGRAVELQHLGNMEPALEFGPDVGAQSVAEGQTQLMLLLIGLGLAVHQITAQLADIDEHGGAGRHHVGPEAAGREPLADHQTRPVQQGRADADQAPGRVIQRQDVEDPVLGRRTGRAGESAHIGAGPRMRDAGRLGQAGGAGGVDIQGRVAVRQAFAHRPGRPHGGGAAHRLVQAAPVAGFVLVAQAQDPQHQGVADQGAGRLDLAPAILVRHHLEGVGDGQAVGQPLARQIRVDQGGGDADLGEADPGRQIFDAVGHHQGDGVAPVQAAPLGPVGVAVGHGVQVAIGQAAALVLDGDVVRELVDGFFKVVAQQNVAIQLDRLDTLEQAEQSAREAHVPAETHARRYSGLCVFHPRS